MADNRYEVHFTPLRGVEKACRRAGMRAGDGTSYWDWVEAEDHTAVYGFPTFERAVEKAREVLPRDVFGEIRIVRMVPDFEEPETWAEDAGWSLHALEDALSEDDPDWRENLAAE